MENGNKAFITAFSFLIQNSIMPAFAFPKGGIATRAVSSCMETLGEMYSGGISEERIVDYCTCQAYAISRFDNSYLRNRWKVPHSFGKKAVERFLANRRSNRYYEDKWLNATGTSRKELLELIKDRKQHPLFRYVNPEYEETTKRRALSTTIGYYICASSTLLWNPFSPSCQRCTKKEVCLERTRLNYPELYRLRIEEFNKKK
ncbi:MAG: hypothetical protein OGM04_12330 [Bacteroides ovatus]|uniref:hypothetical protein n=2 Tax=Bacteroides TaxID=816 RepID=UPI00101C6DCD|nr:MAG: hypothetical protein OGM04_12330 [Bacteroides ovatus]